MNISNLFSFSTFGGANQARTASKSVEEMSPLAQAVQRADLRVQSEVAANTAQLSSLGQLKSAVAELQTAARSLSKLSDTASSSDVKSALSALADAFNAAVAVARDTATQPGVSDASQSAKRLAQNLQALVSNNSVSAQTESTLGLHVQNGLLSFQGQTIDESATNTPADLQTTLKNLADLTERTAAAELDSQGSMNDSMEALKRTAQVLQAQQSALQSAAKATAAYPGERNSGYGVSAYQSNIG